MATDWGDVRWCDVTRRGRGGGRVCCLCFFVSLFLCFFPDLIIRLVVVAAAVVGV